MKSHRLSRLAAALVAAAAATLAANPAHAFGDEGHEVVALIAEHYLTPDVRHKVFAMLAADTSGLAAARDIASEATWADRFRDSDRNTTRVRYEQTHLWHFVDTEIKAPDPAAACFGHLALAPGVPASAGPAKACVVDKIAQFEHELADPATPAPERLMALQFLLHFVGDLHQPLHASDDHDQGGNAKKVRAPGKPLGTLHHYWDSEFVATIGHDPAGVAQQLITGIKPKDRQDWAEGSAADWARESFEAGRDVAYGKLPAPKQGVRQLSATYAQGATRLISTQLRKAGVRLATVLNRSLGEGPASTSP